MKWHIYRTDTSGVTNSEKKDARKPHSATFKQPRSLNCFHWYNMLSTGIFIVLQDHLCLSIAVVVLNFPQVSQNICSSTNICPCSPILQWRFELTVWIKDHLRQELISLYISNSSVSWHSGNFSSHLTEACAFQPFPLCLCIWVLFRWQTGRYSSHILHQHHSLHLPFPLFLLYYLAMQNRRGLVVKCALLGGSRTCSKTS